MLDRGFIYIFFDSPGTGCAISWGRYGLQLSFHSMSRIKAKLFRPNQSTIFPKSSHRVPKHLPHRPPKTPHSTNIIVRIIGQSSCKGHDQHLHTNQGILPITQTSTSKLLKIIRLSKFPADWLKHSKKESSNNTIIILCQKVKNNVTFTVRNFSQGE